MSETTELPTERIDPSVNATEVSGPQTYKDAMLAAVRAIDAPEGSGYVLMVAIRPGDGTVDSSGVRAADNYALVCMLQNLCAAVARELAEETLADKETLSNEDRRCMDALRQASRTFRLVTGSGRRSEEEE